MNKKIIIPALVVMAVFGGAGWHFSTQSFEKAQAASPGGKAMAAGPPVAVEAQKPFTDTLDRTIEAVGNLASNESVVLSPEIAGRVTAILFEEGQSVARDMPLVRLDDVIAKAELAQMQASLTLSSANYERAKTLFSQDAGSGAARDEALAKRNTDQASLDLTKAKLDKTVIRAPFDGIIGLRSISVGDYVNVGQAMVNIESVDPLKVDFRMPEIYLSSLKSGQTIQVKVDAFPGRVFEGEIYAIDPLVDSNGRTVVFRAKLPNADHSLRPGLFARVNVLLGRAENALLLPEEALVPEGKDQFVYKVEGDKPVRVAVKTGARAKGRVEIVDGLRADDTVITAGQMKIRPGSKVKIVQSAPDTEPAAGNAR